MIQVDLPAAFAIGQIYGILAKDYLKKEPEKFTNRLLGPLNFYLTCGYIVAGLYLLIAYPSWETMYITKWVENPYNRPLAAGFYILFMISMVVLGNVGFILAHHWYLKGKDRYVVYGAVIGVVLTFLPFLVRWGVWGKIGTYEQIMRGEGYSFGESPFIYGWLGFMGYMALATIFTGIWFRKRGARLGGENK